MKRKSVLIVEDELSLSEALKIKISKAGYEVLIAQDGAEGLRVALEKKPALILLDIVMPKMDGISMLKELRKDAWGKDVRVVLLTNLDDTGKITDAFEQDALNYLVKSDWKLDDIIKKIDNWISD